MTENSEEDNVVKAISTLMSALGPLDHDARIHVLEFVLKRLGISLTAGTLANSSYTTNIIPTPSNPSVQAAPAGALDIRSFATEKKPKTLTQKLALIGYYLTHLAPVSERRDQLVSEDIRPYFIQAGFELPTSSINTALINAKNAGYLSALDRGKYKLTAVGYNLIAHKLPSNETGQTKRKSTKRSSARRKTKNDRAG
jgi:hypothetical protein